MTLAGFGTQPFGNSPFGAYLATDPLTLGGDATPNLTVDLQPDNALGVFTLDDSQLDGPDTLGWAASGWVNVVCDVLSASVRRGATRLQGPLTRAEAAAVTITVRDDSGLLDPLANGDQVHRHTPLRLRAWGFDAGGLPWSAVLFTGTVADLEAVYSRDDPPTVTITGSDLIADLVAWSAPGWADPGTGAGDDLPQRVALVLAECGIGTVSPDSDKVGQATLAPSTLAKAWDPIVAAADAELGRVWVDSANRLVVRGRGAELSGPVRGTLSDVHGATSAGAVPHCCMADPAVVYGAETLTNLAVATRRAVGTGDTPVQVSREDSWSVARYGPGTVTGTGLELETDAQAAVWAEAVIGLGARPELRVDQVTPVPDGGPGGDWAAAAAAWPAVCATDIGDRWAFALHPLTGGAVERTVGVLGIDMNLSPAGWTMVWTTTEAPTPGTDDTGGWFTLDASLLDEGDLLPQFGGLLGRPLVTIGDSFTARDWWTGVCGWTVQAAADTGRPLINPARASTGYVTAANGVTFGTEADVIPRDAAAVVVWGGYNDAAVAPATVSTAAAALFAEARSRAPAAALVVIGPQWPNSTPSAAILTLRDTIHAVATAAAAELWIDPIAEGWFAPPAGRIGPDGVHPLPTEAVQGYIADLITPRLAAVLPV